MSKAIVAAAVLFSGMGSAFAQDDLDSLLGPAPQGQPATPPPANSPQTGTDAAAPPSGAQSNPPANADATNEPPASSNNPGTPSPNASGEPPATSAAAADKPAVQRAAKNRLVEEIVVTAAKREENISDVPIAISAFSAEKLDALGVQSAVQLSKITPGLTFSTSAGYPQIYLRGVGSDAFLPSADPTVPIYLDGVALLSGHGVSNTLGRISRVEVVKGPQGTLFGRNSTGGAISIVTPDPGPDFSGDVEQGYGNLGTVNTLFYLNLPIFESLGATLSGYNEEHDTYVQNIGAPTVATYSRGGRVKLVYRPFDSLSFNVTGSYGEESGNEGTGSFQNTRVSPAFVALGVTQDPKLDYTVNQNAIGQTVLYTSILTAGADWKLPWIEIKLIGSDQKDNDTSIVYDYDGGPQALVNFDGDDEFFNQATGELQLLSTADTPGSKYFTFVAGAYYLEGNGGFPNLNLRIGGDQSGNGVLAGTAGAGFASSLAPLLAAAGLPTVPLLNGPLNAVSGGLIGTRSFSGYFQGTTHISEFFGWSQQLNLITGARLDRESRSLAGNRLSVVNPANGVQTDLQTFTVPKVTAIQVPLKFELQWFPADGEQIYASFSRGFTSPTYSTVNFFSAPPPLAPEKVNSYEIGTKLQFFDGGLILNGAAFYIQEKNALTGFAGLTSGGIVEFENVPAAKIRGVEGDITLSPFPELDPGFALLASASYLDGKYTSYPGGRGYDVNTGLAFGPSTSILGVPVPDSRRDFTGNEITRTPHLTYNIGLNQSVPLGDNNRLEFNVSTNYSSQFFFDSQNAVLNESPSFQLLDATGSYFYKPWGLQITGFGLNLTKTLYPASVFLLDSGRFQSPNAPRTFGARIKFTF